MSNKVFNRIIAAFVLVVTLVSFTAYGSFAEDKKVITAETGGRPAPFIYTVDNAEDALYTTSDGVYLSGYDIAVLVAAFETEVLKDYTLDLTVSSNNLVDAQQGIIDFAVNNYSYNSDRAQSYYFSYPYTKAKYAIITAKGTVITSFEELAASGLPVETNAGNNVANAIERWNEANPDKQITIEYTSVDITAQLQHIAEGTHAGIGDTPVWAAFRQAYPELFDNLSENVISDEEALLITEHSTSHLLFGKTAANAKVYQQLLSEAIYELYQNGTLQELADKYTGLDIVPVESDFQYLN